MQLVELLQFLVAALERLQIRYLVTGSMASFAYGDPRVPHDIDVVVELPPAKFAEFRAAFSGCEFHTHTEGVGEGEARLGEFTIRRPGSPATIDVIVASDSDYDRCRLQRGQRLNVLAGRELTFAAPEDVILKKMEWYQKRRAEKHLQDIAGLLRARGERLDRAYITVWADRLGLAAIWELVRRRIRT